MPKLLVVATPIGNLNDLTPRMLEALAQTDLIAAEDTRVTLKLLNHLGLKKPLVSCHQHNEASRSRTLTERMLAEDLTVALTCDAGTPGISDPGAALVRACHEAGIEVSPVCGPSAAAAAVSVSGFDAREFAFVGFLPRDKKPLRERLDAMYQSGIPVFVAYESPHRVLALVAEIAARFPESNLCLCCDLSKRYEKILVGPAGEVLARMRENPNLEKGEYALVLDLSPLPPPAPAEAAETAEQRLLAALLSGATLDEAAARALEACPRNEVYRARLNVKRLLDRLREADD